MLKKFSINKRIASRTKTKYTKMIKKSIIPFYGKYGWLKDPKKSIYNRIYYRTRFSFFDIIKFIIKLFK